MIERYSLPPGYTYELLPDLRFGIVDRMDEIVLSVAIDGFEMSGWAKAIANIWELLIEHPTLTRTHAAVFMTWRLRESPLDLLVGVA